MTNTFERKSIEDKLEFIPNDRNGKIAARIQEIPNSEQLAILLPAYLETKDYQHLVALAHDLGDLNFTTVRFDPTGTWESEGKIEEYNMTNYLKDLKEVIHFMKGKGQFRRIFLVGHSLGGTVGMLYGSQNPDIAGVVAIMSPRSLIRPENKKKLEAWKRQGFTLSSRDLPTDPNKKREYKVPFSFAQDAIGYDALRAVKDFHKPLVLIAGENDDKVPAANVQEIYDAANEPKTLSVVPGIDHDYRYSSEGIQMIDRRVVESLRKLE